MLETIVGALLPALVTVLLGYLAARHHDFGPKDTPVLVRLVMTYALPLALFVGTVSLPRSTLFKDLPLLLALAAAMIVVYGFVFAVCRFILGFSPGVSFLWALAASAPDVPFIGPVVIGYLYGPVGNIPIAVGSILLNITVVPATIILLARYAGGGTEQTTGADVLAQIVAGLKEPVVWFPLLGLALVLMGIHVPALLAGSLAVLGHAAAGIALFTVGIILAAYRVRVNRFVLSLVSVKNLLQPALVCVGLLAVGCTRPLLGEAVMTAALPMITLIPILAARYHLAETEAASAMFLSFVGSLLTLGLFIAVTGGQLSQDDRAAAPHTHTSGVAITQVPNGGLP
ncbi:MAG: AEC family transporter [Solirubrobacterales bacterium]|nr:AEC family transporter [Solirubrobacterales bacterium]